jgi:hypothetical protein
MGPRPRRAVRLTPAAPPDHAVVRGHIYLGVREAMLIDPPTRLQASRKHLTGYQITIKICRTMNAECCRLMRKQRGR